MRLCVMSSDEYFLLVNGKVLKSTKQVVSSPRYVNPFPVEALKK